MYKIKIGSRVIVTATLLEDAGYVPELNNFIGQEFIVDKVNMIMGRCRLISNCYGSWWFPIACVRHVDDKMGVTNYNVKNGLSVIIYNLGNININENLNNYNNNWRKLCNIPARIVSEPIIIGNYRSTIKFNRYFVNVDINGDIYRLPICSLRLSEPIYKPRKIYRNV